MTQKTEKKLVGIINFNPDQNPDTRQYVERISALIPPDAIAEGISFRDVLRISNNYDALILSGSRLSATDYQRMAESNEILEEDYLSVDKVVQALSHYNGPMFGICFGSQIVAHIMGGKLGKLEKPEAGYLEHQLTNEGKNDPIFGHLPNIFWAAHMHTDYVDKLPEGEGIKSDVLATRNGFVHAYRSQKKGIVRYGTQPHPEMSNLINATFLVRVNGNWLKDTIGGQEYAKALAIPANAEFAFSQTITRFVEMIK